MPFSARKQAGEGCSSASRLLSSWGSSPRDVRGRSWSSRFRVRNDGLQLGLLFALVEGDVLGWDRMGAWTFAEICSRLLLDAHGDDVELKEHLLMIEEFGVAFYRNSVDMESYKDGLRRYFDRHETKRLES